MNILIVNETQHPTLVLKAALNLYIKRNGEFYKKHTIIVGEFNPKKPPDLVIGSIKPDGYNGVFLNWSLFPSPIRGGPARATLDDGLKQVVKEKADEYSGTRSKKTNKEHRENSTTTANKETVVRKRGRPRGSRSRKQTL